MNRQLPERGFSLPSLGVSAGLAGLLGGFAVSLVFLSLSEGLLG
jgi:hypothetical protein